jgi:glycosyltransferase involved in cell wall biosynthesis
MGDLISVIVPVYKVEDYLERCVKSIQRQTYTNLEIILVDDGSPDKSGQMCDEMAGADARIRVIHKPNGGLSDARNAGLAVAQGEYVGFIDSDDYIEPGMYEYMLRALKERHADIAICCVKKIFVDEMKDDVIQDVVRDKIYSKRKAMYELVRGIDVENFAWNKLYKRELFDGIEFPKGRIFEDMICIPQVFQRADLVVHVNKGFYNYLRRSDSILGSWKIGTQAEFTHAQQDRNDFITANWPEFTPPLMEKYRYSLEDLINCALRTPWAEAKPYQDLLQKELWPYYRDHMDQIGNDLSWQKRTKYRIMLERPRLFWAIWPAIRGVKSFLIHD